MIYYCIINRYDDFDFILEYADKMPITRYVQCSKYKFKEDKIECVLAVLLLDIVLNDLNIKTTLVFPERKKPYDLNKKVYFNISHTRGMVVIAIDDKEIGVDVEKPFSFNDNHKKYVLSKSDILNYETILDQSLFCKIWTSKEAIVKQKGLGLIDDFSQLQFNYLLNKQKYMSLFLESFEISNYIISCYSNKQNISIKEINKNQILRFIRS